MAKQNPKTRQRPQSGTPWEPSDLQSVGFLAAMTAVFFLKILLGNAHLWEDFVYQWYPFRQYAATALASGELPLWNPYTVNGMPFLAEIQTEVFYLPMLALTLFVKNGHLDVYWLELVNVLHYFLAGAGMYLLAGSFSLRRMSALVAGTTFAFSGFLVTHAIHQVITGVAAWYPLLLFMMRKALQEKRWTWVFIGARDARPQLLRRLAADVPLLLFLPGGIRRIRDRRHGGLARRDHAPRTPADFACGRARRPVARHS